MSPKLLFAMHHRQACAQQDEVYAAEKINAMSLHEDAGSQLLYGVIFAGMDWVLCLYKGKSHCKSIQSCLKWV